MKISEKIKINNLQISYNFVENNSKQVLLFCHGFGSSSKSFDKVLNRFENYNCYAIDYPGHGKSEVDLKNISIPYFASIVSEFINILNLTNVTIVGHSLGGGIVSYLHNNKRIKNFVLLSPINPSIVGKELELRDILIPTSPKKLMKAWSYLFYSSEILKQLNLNAKNAVLAMKDYQNKKEFFVAVADDVVNNNRQWEILYNYLSINKKVKLIFGDSDKIIEPKPSILWLEKSIKNIDVSVIKKCGHSPQFEKTEETILLIKEFNK